MKAWLKHAFALDPAQVEPTPEQSQLIDRLAREIVRRRLTVPALAFLEMSRPMNFLGSQALHFLAPMISAVTDSPGHRHLAEFLEQRGSIELLCQRITDCQRDADADSAKGEESSGSSS